MNKTCASPEADRLAYQTQKNIVFMANYREQLLQLKLLQSELAGIILKRHINKNAVRIGEAINSGQRLLHNGTSLADAITHCDELLEVENA
ncbi:MAG: hypothetical protein KAJ19_05015 [Gammaproteobacteria bacterium]|nr:hypothetical protein [Gammaproteobacteria bacterium]